MSLFWSLKFKKLANFFWGQNGQNQLDRLDTLTMNLLNLEEHAMKLTNEVVALRSKFEYLQQRIDKLEVPR